eukprot:gene12135-15247_t
MLEEDLLPTLPMGAPGMGLGLVGLQSLLEDHERMKEHREKKQKEKLEKEARKQAALAEMRDEDVKKPGFQRLRATQYDELRRQLTGKGGSNIPTDQVIGDDTLVIGDDTLAGFGRMNLAKSVDMGTPSSGGAPGSARRISKTVGKSNTARRGSPSMTQSMKVSSAGKPADQTFADWLASHRPQEGKVFQEGGLLAAPKEECGSLGCPFGKACALRSPTQNMVRGPRPGRYGVKKATCLKYGPFLRIEDGDEVEKIEAMGPKNPTAGHDINARPSGARVSQWRLQG